MAAKRRAPECDPQIRNVREARVRLSYAIRDLERGDRLDALDSIFFAKKYIERAETAIRLARLTTLPQQAARALGRGR